MLCDMGVRELSSYKFRHYDTNVFQCLVVCFQLHLFYFIYFMLSFILIRRRF
jgi:hypothetical protein